MKAKSSSDFREILFSLSRSRDLYKVFETFTRLAACALAMQTREAEYFEAIKGWKKVERFMWAWKSVGFYPVSHLVWVKDYCSRKEHTQWHHDCAYLLAKGKPSKPKEPVSDVFEWRYGGCFEHPAQRPVNTLTPLVAAFSKPDDLVLDPFAGSGSTGLAARSLQRHYCLIELVEKYHRIAARRLQASGGAR